ncbi:unnamed protein product [Auanema sp. JU1783]|nr:unnamed protein product [Auanema sp. JU1783]
MDIRDYSAAFYVVCSTFCSLLGKVIVTRFFFDYPTVILLLQNATSLFIIEVLRIINVLKISPYSFDRGRHVMLPSMLLCFSQWITVCSFEGIGLPVFDSMKRLTAPLIIIVSIFIHKQSRYDKHQVAAVVALSLISFITVNLEMSLDRYSFMYGIIAALFQAIAYVHFERLSQNFEASELVYLHCFNSLVVYLIADIVQDEIRDSFMFMMTSAHPLFSGVFLILLFSSLPLHYATFYTIQHLGALNTQVISNIRAAFQILIAYAFSIYMFYGVGFGIMNYLGLLAIIPTAYYCFLTFRNDTSLKMPWATKA